MKRLQITRVLCKKDNLLFHYLGHVKASTIELVVLFVWSPAADDLVVETCFNDCPFIDWATPLEAFLIFPFPLWSHTRDTDGCVSPQALFFNQQLHQRWTENSI